MLGKRVPRLSETFILNECLKLRRQGLPVDLFAIMDPKERSAQPETNLRMDQPVVLSIQRLTASAANSMVRWAAIESRLRW